MALPRLPKIELNALSTAIDLYSGFFQMSVVKTIRADIVQTMIVSTNTSKIPHIPCLAGWSVTAVECA
ncbi:Uncharacterised protein [Chlamydia trachomatis]|nr:Uncharacterised protein [Chlamydia trachomatis]